MNINEISKTVIDIEKHLGWPMRSIPETLKKLLTHIKDLEAENKRLLQAIKNVADNPPLSSDGFPGAIQDELDALSKET